MKYRIVAPAAALMLLLLAVTGANAQSSTKSKQKGQPVQTVANKPHSASPPSDPVFSAQEITIVQDYFKTNRNALPPGLAKHEALSPSQQKQLVKNGKLPSGLKKKIQPLPIELERQLTVLPTGYRRVAISSHVIVMSSATGLIYDVIRDVIP